MCQICSMYKKVLQQINSTISHAEFIFCELETGKGHFRVLEQILEAIKVLQTNTKHRCTDARIQSCRWIQHDVIASYRIGHNGKFGLTVAAHHSWIERVSASKQYIGIINWRPIELRSYIEHLKSWWCDTIRETLRPLQSRLCLVGDVLWWLDSVQGWRTCQHTNHSPVWAEFER